MIYVNGYDLYKMTSKILKNIDKFRELYPTSRKLTSNCETNYFGNITIIIDSNVGIRQLEVMINGLYYALNNKDCYSELTKINFIYWNSDHDIKCKKGSNQKIQFKQVESGYETIINTQKDFSLLLDYIKSELKSTEQIFFITNGLSVCKQMDDAKKFFSFNSKHFFWLISSNKSINLIQKLDATYKKRLVGLMNYTV